MGQLIRFLKAEATGNDFVIFDGRELDLDRLHPDKVAWLCDRNFGVGGDGAIMISSEPDVDFKYDYYNANGHKSTMCGNGSRAAVLTANILGLVKRGDAISFRASDGLHSAEIISEDRIRVEILLDPAVHYYDEDTFFLPADLKPVAFLNTGVPHLIIECSTDVESIDVQKIGSHLRSHSSFPEGTNVNFVRVEGADRIAVRTYERGVEAETLSCGTGVTASALAFWDRGLESASMNVKTKGGRIGVERKDNRFFLEGPARLVFVGQCLVNL